MQAPVPLTPTPRRVGDFVSNFSSALDLSSQVVAHHETQQANAGPWTSDPAWSFKVVCTSIDLVRMK